MSFWVASLSFSWKVPKKCQCVSHSCIVLFLYKQSLVATFPKRPLLNAMHLNQLFLMHDFAWRKSFNRHFNLFCTLFIHIYKVSRQQQPRGPSQTCCDSTAKHFRKPIQISSCWQGLLHSSWPILNINHGKVSSNAKVVRSWAAAFQSGRET